MLRSINEMKGYAVKGEDGTIGRVSEFLFDGNSWDIRYQVVDVGEWLSHQKVLISPEALRDPTLSHFPVRLTKEQIRHSPPIDTDKPVSMREEERIHQYYGWSPYWHAYQGITPTPVPVPSKSDTEFQRELEQDEKRSNLRSTRVVTGYRLTAADHESGHVDDFIVETDLWKVQYLAIALNQPLHKKRVLISTTWITEISWKNQRLYTGHKAEAIRFSPEFDPDAAVNREYEEVLFDYYGRPKSWIKREDRPHKYLHAQV